MPHYDYRCPGLDCQTIVEVYYPRPPEGELVLCPRCQRGMVRQIGAGTAVVFRGEGFYCTSWKEHLTEKET